MADFSAKDVQELRKSTGAGMMDAKKALVEAEGDMEAANQILREKGLAKASSREDRENNQGVVAVASSDAGVSLVHLKSETDFSAKSDEFQALTQELADLVLAKGPDGVSEKAQVIEDMKLTVKENIEIGTAVQFLLPEGGIQDAYLHGGGTAGVLVEGKGISADLLHEIALHIAFAKPTYLKREDVPADLVSKEEAALLEITKAEGKPEGAWPKIVEGRLNSWFGDRVLLEQGVFGEKETVAQRIGDGELTRFELALIG